MDAYLRLKGFMPSYYENHQADDNCCNKTA